MRAAVLRDGQIVVRNDVEDPVAGFGQVLVEVKACGICGSDLRFAKAGSTMVEMMRQMRGAPILGSPDLDLPIEDLDLSERPRNCLKRAQVNTIGELVERTHDDLLAITNFGQKSLDEVLQKLDERGLSLRNKEG